MLMGEKLNEWNFVDALNDPTRGYWENSIHQPVYFQKSHRSHSHSFIDIIRIDSDAQTN